MSDVNWDELDKKLKAAMKVCEKCGGLKATYPETFAGTPCTCVERGSELDHLRQDNERLKGDVALWKEGCERNADLYRDAVRAQDNYRLDLKAHKSCLEVARGALVMAFQYVTIEGSDDEEIKLNNALHQITELLGGQK